MSLERTLTNRSTKLATRKVSGRTHHDFLRWRFVSHRSGGLRTSFTTVLLGCTNQHARDARAVAVARNQAEQSGEFCPPTSRCLPGGRPGQARAPHPYRRRPTGIGQARARELLGPCGPTGHLGAPSSRQLSLSASVKSMHQAIRVWQAIFACSETIALLPAPTNRLALNAQARFISSLVSSW